MIDVRYDPSPYLLTRKGRGNLCSRYRLTCSKVFRIRIGFGICLNLRPSIAMLGPLRPVVFERLGTSALVNPPVCRLVSFMENDPLGILQVQHASLGCRVVCRHQIFQDLAELAVVRHVAAKDQTAIFVNDEERIGPSPVATVDLAIQAVDQDRESDIFQSLQVAAQNSTFCSQRAMRRIMFRRMRLAGVQKKKRNATGSVEFLV